MSTFMVVAQLLDQDPHRGTKVMDDSVEGAPLTNIPPVDLHHNGSAPCTPAPTF